MNKAGTGTLNRHQYSGRMGTHLSTYHRIILRNGGVMYPLCGTRHPATIATSSSSLAVTCKRCRAILKQRGDS